MSPLTLARKDGRRSSPAAPAAVLTRAAVAAPPERVWEALLFFEQIEERPPFLLRLLLPRPLRTVGSKSAVGDEAVCLYEKGRLVKRVTRVEPGRLYVFVVAEQDLSIGGSVRLLGGSYELRKLSDGGTEIALETLYESPLRPRWLFAPAEAAVCHAFHRHILAVMKRRAERGPRA